MSRDRDALISRLREVLGGRSGLRLALLHALIDLDTDRPGYARMRDAWIRRVAARGL